MNLSDFIAKAVRPRCIVVESTGCWEWQGTKTKAGYGQIYINKRRVYVHRAVLGDIPAGHYACHRCDNPSCCNPDHLFAGTPKDNAQDCIAKDRFHHNEGRVGEKSPTHRLTEQQVRSIRALSAAGIPQREIANRFNVRQSTVWYIVSRRTWAHLQEVA